MANIPIYKLTQTESIIDDTLIKAEEFVKGYSFMGTIEPTDTPVTESINVFYYAVQAGTYTNYGGLVITEPGFVYFNADNGYTTVPFSFTGSGISGVVSVNNKTGVVTITTDDIPEGATNKYFTGTVPTDVSDLTDTNNLISSKAPIVNVLTKDNTNSYTPVLDYHPATKKFVDEAIITAIQGISNIGTADIAKDVDWDTATLPPYVIDPALANHIADTTIHFTEAEIDKYTRSEVDNLINALDYRLLGIENWMDSPATTDTVTKALFFSHIYNLSVHFTKEEMLAYLLANMEDLDEGRLIGIIGDREYDTSNYIVSNETITDSLITLDDILYNHVSDLDIHFKISDINVYCAGGVRV